MTNLTADLELEALKDFLKNAWQFLKNTQGTQSKLIELPWYWVLGTAHAGKSFFIKQGQLNLIPTKHFATDPHDETEHHKRCNWWCCDQAILLDVPGSYLSEDATINWPKFLGVAKKYLAQKPLAGIVLTLNLAEWATFNKNQQQSYAQQLRQNILLLQKELRAPCPIYGVFTHLDQLAGFAEFFGDLGHEEQQQAWGFNLLQSTFATELSLPKLFKTRFDQLLKRLHSRVIWRSQQERSIEKHALIQHFPWQLDSLKESLTHLFYQLGDVFALAGTTPLQGIYFVSNLQHGQLVDCIPKTFNSEPKPTATMVAHSKQRNAYFTKQLWRKIIFAQNTTASINISQTSTPTKSFTIYSAAATIVLSCSLLMAHSFNTKISHLNTAATALSNYRLLEKQLPITTPNLNQVLPALNSLQEVVKLIQTAHLPWLIQDLHRKNTLNSLAEKTYHQTLIHYFLPSLSTLLEPILANTNDPTLLYGALRMYLMLGDPGHLDPNAMKNWFSSYWQITLKNNPELQRKLTTHLDALLASPIPPLVLNQQLIYKARLALNSAPDYQLAYSILRNENNTGSIQPLAFSGNQQIIFNKIFSVFGKMPEIPNMYTAKKFQDIYFNQIPKACVAISTGNWVLGLNNRPNTSSNTQLSDKVRIQYLQDYSRTWQALLANISINGWKDWQQAKEVLTIIADKPEILNQIIEVISQNTSVKELVPKDITTNDLQLIQIYLGNQFHLDTHGLHSMQISMNQLNDYLTDIVKDRDSNKAAFLSAKARLAENSAKNPIQQAINLASTLPEPLQDWLNSLATNVWRLVLEHSNQYINHTWQTEVVKTYLQNINYHYPLFKTSKADISLDDFAHFFGPEGDLDRYFKNYLAPFIDTHQAEWSYRSLNGQTINLGSNLLMELEKAALIRSMFFSTGQEFAVTFSLQPAAFEPGVKSIKISLNGQSIEDLQDQVTTPHFFTWPGSAKEQTVSLTFINDQGQKTTKVEKGPWAFFRILDQSNLEMSADTKNFQVTFDLNGNAARYQLLASNPVNPFIPGILEEFRCPLDLRVK